MSLFASGSVAGARRGAVPFARRQLLGTREPVRHVPPSAVFANEVLQRLRAERYTVRAWSVFWARSWSESRRAARARRRAAADVHLLHAALFLATGDPRAAISWTMAWTHVGLIPVGQGLGVANALSLLRANLPIIAAARPRLVATVAVLTDLADGAIARRTGGVTPFGVYADGLADVVFWTWFAWRCEEDPWLRRTAMLSWLAPSVVFTMAAMTGGRMPVVRRLMIVRTLSAALQSTLTIRAFRRSCP